MLWSTIRALKACTPLAMPEGFATVYLFNTPSNDGQWLVGEYKDMTKIATDLRENRALRDLLTKHQVRLGLRETDKPPADVERQERYGTRVPGLDVKTDFMSYRVKSLAPPVRSDRPIPFNRKSDREQNVQTFWETQTPQSHHIVEFNNLETLGVSKSGSAREMDYERLPAVLLAAEFHQRYYSAILKPAQGWTKEKLQTDIVRVYHSLYHSRGSTLFEPLWQISRVILREAGIPCR